MKLAPIPTSARLVPPTPQFSLLASQVTSVANHASLATTLHRPSELVDRSSREMWECAAPAGRIPQSTGQLPHIRGSPLAELSLPAAVVVGMIVALPASNISV
jgi:hypothetical protein